MQTRRWLFFYTALLVLLSVTVALVSAPLLTVLATRGFPSTVERLERWRFSDLPATESGLEQWASEQKLLYFTTRRTALRELEMRYSRATRSQPVSIPWQRLGYQEAKPGARDQGSWIANAAEARVVLSLLLSLQLGLLAATTWHLARTRVRLPWQRTTWLTAAGAGLSLGVALLFVSGMYAALVTLLFGKAALPPTLAFDLSQYAVSYQVAIVMAGVVLAPLVEECFFRGVVLGSFGDNNEWAWGFALSSGLFALAHGQLVLLPVYVVMGLLLGAVYRRHGLLAAVTAHAVNNSVAFGFLYLRLRAQAQL